MGICASKTKSSPIQRKLTRKPTGFVSVNITIKQDFSQTYKIVEPLGYADLSRISKQNSPFNFELAETISEQTFQSNIERINLCITLVLVKLKTIQKHPCLLQLKEVYTSNSEYQLIYEPVKGQTFHRYFCSLKDFQIKEVTRQVLKALDLLHKNKIVHGGIDQNSFIFYTRTMVKLAGFVLPNRSVFPRSQKPPNIKTFFRPPEVINGWDASHQSDIWAVGVFVIYLFTGRSLFEDKSEGQVQKKITNSNYQYLINTNEFIPQDAKEFLATIFYRKPSDRPDSATLLLHPWLQIQKPQFTILSNFMISSLDNSKEQFQITSLAYYITQAYYDSVREKILRIFLEMDTENNGTISRDNFEKILLRRFKPEETPILSFLEKLDQINRQKYISYEMLISALFSDTDVPENINKVLKCLDQSLKQRVNKEDIEQYLDSIYVKQNIFRSVFHKEDKDEDHHLNAREFKNFFQRAQKTYLFVIDKPQLKKQQTQSMPIELRELDKLKLEMSPNLGPSPILKKKGTLGSRNSMFTYTSIQKDFKQSTKMTHQKNLSNQHMDSKHQVSFILENQFDNKLNAPPEFQPVTPISPQVEQELKGSQKVDFTEKSAQFTTDQNQQQIYLSTPVTPSTPINEMTSAKNTEGGQKYVIDEKQINQEQEILDTEIKQQTLQSSNVAIDLGGSRNSDQKFSRVMRKGGLRGSIYSVHQSLKQKRNKQEPSKDNSDYGREIPTDNKLFQTGLSESQSKQAQSFISPPLIDLSSANTFTQQNLLEKGYLAQTTKHRRTRTSNSKISFLLSSNQTSPKRRGKTPVNEQYTQS